MAKLNNFSVAIYMDWRLQDDNAVSIKKLINKETYKLQSESDIYFIERDFFPYSNPTVVST